MKTYQKIATMVLMTCVLFLYVPLQAMVATANAHFGSDSYVRDEGEYFNIGLYIEASEGMSSYSLTMTYDPAILHYEEGANQHGEGYVVINGTSTDGYVKQLVNFRAIAPGDTTLHISEVQAVDGNEENCELTIQEVVPISIVPTALPLEGIEINGEAIADFTPENLNYLITVPYENDVITITTKQETVGDQELIYELEVGSNVIALDIEDEEEIVTTYTLTIEREAESETEEPTDVVEQEIVQEAATKDEETIEEPEIPALIYSEEESRSGLLQSIVSQKVVLIPVAILILLVVSISALITYFEYEKELERERRRALAAKKKTKPKAKKKEVDQEENKGEGLKIIDIDTEDILVDAQEPMIVVDDICMEFKVATQNVSGVKEWFIQTIQGKMSYRILHALDHISFEVYPGEVVGIIGTNGSGKSTLLKIVSGVLQPTSGKVHADRSKIQLLTLGTGFDMELTAKENVYLNGSIIGYTREFIDEHYDEIVAFAELEDFMEEKVKNFSSGMVSRLGFAIATAGDAAEILILDEVLSVGDEFFRKKSLKRVREMIHGGSTVLMVSHSMDTILKNCSKVVWIEKGVMKMVGEPEEVCGAYQKMNV